MTYEQGKGKKQHTEMDGDAAAATDRFTARAWQGMGGRGACWGGVCEASQGCAVSYHGAPTPPTLCGPDMEMPLGSSRSTAR